ncbi:MAG: hypothetical protein IKN04_11220 [Clostridia bacterium]|nr:hypothetical protein [Clostridia bacterium]
MNYRVTIEPLSDTEKKSNPETITLCLDGLVLAGQYDPKEVNHYAQPGQADLPPGVKGQISAVMGSNCVEAIFQLISNGLPEQMRAALALRMIKDRMGMVEIQEIASMTIDPSRGGA